MRLIFHSEDTVWAFWYHFIKGYFFFCFFITWLWESTGILHQLRLASVLMLLDKSFNNPPPPLAQTCIGVSASYCLHAGFRYGENRQPWIETWIPGRKTDKTEGIINHWHKMLDKQGHCYQRSMRETYKAVSYPGLLFQQNRGSTRRAGLQAAAGAFI